MIPGDRRRGSAEGTSVQGQEVRDLPREPIMCADSAGRRRVCSPDAGRMVRIQQHTPFIAE